jgi:NADH:ubiquinone oxidoreductase subunit
MGRHCCRAFEIRAALNSWLECLRQRLVSSMSKLDSAAARWHQTADKHASVNTRAAMKTFLLRFFTWWNGQTFGTQVWTKLHGEFVGEDEFGNRYYRTKGGKIDPTLGLERRWVIYNGVAEASRVPPSWHGWLHHTVDVLPTQDKTAPHPWEKPHRPNLTGTPNAHRPTGSTLAQGRRPKATGDYKAWSPGNQ